MLSCPTEHQGAQGGAFPASPSPAAPPSELWVPAQVLQRLEARRQQGPEAEAAAVERQMEEARENIRKAEVGPPVRELGVASRSVTSGWGCRDREGLWLGCCTWGVLRMPPDLGMGAMGLGHHHRCPGGCDNVWCPQVSRVKAEARLALLRAAGLDVDTWLAGATVGTGEETPTGLDPAEFDDYEDSDEPDEDDEPGPPARTYPYTCRVIFGYQVWPCLPGPHPACPGMAPQPVTLSPSPAGLPGGRAVHQPGRGAGDHRGWGCRGVGEGGSRLSPPPYWEAPFGGAQAGPTLEPGMFTWFLPPQARNKAGQVGYVPEKYLLSLGCDSGAGLGPPGPSALHRQLSSIMAAELVLEPGGGCWASPPPQRGGRDPEGAEPPPHPPHSLARASPV